MDWGEGGGGGVKGKRREERAQECDLVTCATLPYGCKARTQFRVLKIDRTESRDLPIIDDGVIYNANEIEVGWWQRNALHSFRLSLTLSLSLCVSLSIYLSTSISISLYYICI